ncbi:MAG: SPOR domain-containing protein [Prevotellaceae bacterium]|nr:SPOR domain-containing protein [Prevotellaceae bacterium]
MKVIAALLTLLCVASTSSAQTFTERLQRNVAGKGKVTVVHSAAIDKLVNGNQPDATPTKPKPVTPADTDKKATTHNEAKKTHTEATKTHTVATKTDDSKDDFDIPTVDMRKKVMARSYKVNGYRVQAFAGGNSRTDRQKAQNIGDAIKMQFPEQPVYVHFYSPRWICRVGNYRTYEEAHAMLLELKKMGYQQATIVKGKISVQY